MTDSFVRVTDKYDVLCNKFIEILQLTCKELNISYGKLNIILFCIIMPGLILLSLLGYTLALSNNKKLKTLSKVLYVIILLFLLSLLILSCYLWFKL